MENPSNQQPRPKESASFDQVFNRELDHVLERRRRAEKSNPHPRNFENTDERAYWSSLLGLSFSGGGIRSATFNLGILRALADHHLLRRVDYISTVSGGGYIGGWFQSLLRHSHAQTKSADDVMADVESKLCTEGGNSASEHPSIRSLRDYSNYLSPRLGLLSGDTWALITTYLRNVLLNLSMLILALSALLSLPRLLAVVQNGYFGMLTEGNQLNLDYLALGIGVTLTFAAVASVTIGKEFGNLSDHNPVQPNASGDTTVWLYGVFPALLGAFALTAWISYIKQQSLSSDHDWIIIPAIVSVFTGLCWCMIYAGAKWRWRNRVKPGKWAGIVINGMLAGLVVGFVADFAADHLYKNDHAILTPVYGAPLAMALMVLISFLHIGLMGVRWGSMEREWLSRLAGNFLLAGLGWLLLFAISLIGPLLFLISSDAVSYVFSIGWVSTTIAGLLAGKTESKSSTGQWINKAILAVAPYIFLFGLFIVLSRLTSMVVEDLSQFLGHAKSDALDILRSIIDTTAFPYAVEDWNWILACYIQWQRDINLGGSVMAVLAMTLIVLWVLSRRININDFSLQNMYRNRLVRAYLGSPYPDAVADQELVTGHRYRDPFIGFSTQDDIRLSQVGFGPDSKPGEASLLGPYPIVNTAINLAGGRELAWQERKAASFVLSPLFCGYNNPVTDPGCYHETKRFASRHYADHDRPHELTLGDAIATSGAAASSAMGYRTTIALAAMLTTFNVRLGRWVGNPYKASYRFSYPIHAAWYLLKEAISATREDADFVNLSDGGHFENLGIYELVRRRCRYIIACDAGADPDFSFEDLGNAIRKCRIDFGVKIHINTDDIRRRDERGTSGSPCAIGSIDYGAGRLGTLLYIKASRITDMSADVIEYADASPDFPHETTGDQFYSESQFESYHQLGVNIGHRVLGEIDEAIRTHPDHQPSASQLFARLRDRWVAPASATAQDFTRLTNRFTGLMQELGKREDLKFLDAYFYPEWSALMHSVKHKTPGEDDQPVPPTLETFRQDSMRDFNRRLARLPDQEDERRAGFYFCNQLLQLMEDVYIDLNMESEWDHPDNSGWMNLFRHWSWAPMLRVTWSICASTYGRRFQRFCTGHLGLDLGQVRCMIDQPLSADLPLNALERYQISKLLKEDGTCSVCAFSLEISEAVSSDDTPAGSVMSYGIGYVVLSDNRILMFRIQDHLRRMGLARKALKSLFESQPSRHEPPPIADLNELDESVRRLMKNELNETRYHRFRAMVDEVWREFQKQKLNRTGGDTE